jgi:exosortase
MTEGGARTESAAGAHSLVISESSAQAESPRLSRRLSVITALVATLLTVWVYAPILYFLALQWRDSEDYSHGMLIVPLSMYFAWERRDQLRRAPIVPSWWGLLPLTLGAITLMVGRLGGELMNMRVSFVLTLIGLVLLLLGRKIFRVLLFPLLFLFLMIPLPESLLNVIAFPLQLVAADLAVKALYLLQIPALREGNIVHLANAQLFVAEACSGLRSLLALITLGVVFAYFFHKRLAERLLVVLSAVPIAILVNAFRVALTGILTHRYGESMALGVIHETQGLFTFALAFLLLLLQARILSLLFHRGERLNRPDRVT